MTTHLKSFSSTIPNLQLAWDSVSLGLLKECPRKYFYSIIQAWQPLHTSVHLTFGILYHKGLEVYDHSKAAGKSHDDSLDDAVDYLLKATVERLPNGSWRPWNSGDSYKNRFTLLRTVVWNLEQFKDDPAKVIILASGKPAVELSFRFEIDLSLGGESAMLCGHLDKLVNFNDQIWVMDHKTTKWDLDEKYYRGFNPDNQMTLYTIASQVVYGQETRGIIIDGAQILVNSSRYRRGFTNRSKDELAEWLEETKFYIKQAEGFARHEFWPKNDKACGNFEARDPLSTAQGCPFRDVCSASPKVRPKLLEANFKKEVWDPLETRGDI